MAVKFHFAGRVMDADVVSSGDERPLKDGTKRSGFVTAKENRPPRECGNCRWFTPGQDACHHPEVIQDPEVEHYEDGRGKVDADDCCDNMQSTDKPRPGYDPGDDKGFKVQHGG